MALAGHVAPDCFFDGRKLDADSVAWLEGLRSVSSTSDATTVWL
jgi:hypothetical protein